MARRPDPVRAAALAERRKRVLQARLEGRSFRAIADAEELSVSTVHDDYTRALGDIPRAEADSLRKVEGARLDALQAAVWEKAMLGNLDAGHQVLRIIDRRCRLFGLDAPQQVELSAGDVDLDATVAKVLEAAQAAVRVKDGEEGSSGVVDA
ncbi:hypothetical protein B842_03480 [Corynebacterium humireducens NBRC 106098 = DSM 45392]|uniref:Uncharacterized protein n=1 Tax=Corynebacterium humireducens NBRC 106098 = DSM 45392 TaxID=1223515 RepID=A0A0B5DA22_9CORY|nr:hypothetical protein [Corynebacterium humireducens]AJE32549.1 hypothetical protein B842_03480 [Corynebacterium humireducens NBRC 106098 = DSM 45392]